MATSGEQHVNTHTYTNTRERVVNKPNDEKGEGTKVFFQFFFSSTIPPSVRGTDEVSSPITRVYYTTGAPPLITLLTRVLYVIVCV